MFKKKKIMFKKFIILKHKDLKIKQLLMKILIQSKVSKEYSVRVYQKT